MAGEYSLYIQSPWARWNETFEGKIVERNLIEKKVVFFQIIALEKDKNRQNVKIWRDPVPRSGLAGGVRK